MSEIFSYGLTVAVQVVILFLLIAVGFILSKRQTLTKPGIEQITDLLLFVVTPCVIINSFMKVDLDADTIRELLTAFGCAFFTHLVGILVAFSLRHVKPLAQQAVYRFGIIFSNGGFMSLPMAQALVGEKGVLLVSTYVIAINVLNWTYGVTLYPAEKQVSRKKALLNPGVIGVVLGLPFLFLPFASLPAIVSEPVSYFAALNTPLAMIITGFYLTKADLKTGLQDKVMWLTVGARLLVVPAIVFVLYRFALKLEGDLLISVMIPACAPCAVNNMMISAKFGGDTAVASRLISIATLISIVTMPLLLMLTKL